MPRTGGSHRIGITGIPGAGKSTFIEAFGTMLTARKHRVAVLAVDPSSSVSGGSILGDKTRMPRLSADENAFIRPSPSAGTLGGVAAKTRESLLLCEAASYDVVLVETMGVGQSESVVAEMTDFFLVLLVAGSGDELQGIKRGILELADLVAVNKADGDNVERARAAAYEFDTALKYMRPSGEGPRPSVLTCSALDGSGLPEIWEAVTEHRRAMMESGWFEERRREQRLHWMWTILDDQLRTLAKGHPAVHRQLEELEEGVRAGEVPPTVAAHRLLQAFTGNDIE